MELVAAVGANERRCRVDSAYIELHFETDCATPSRPVSLAPLGHDVRLDAPAGIATGIAQVVQLSAAGPSLDLRPRRLRRLLRRDATPAGPVVARDAVPDEEQLSVEVPRSEEVNGSDVVKDVDAVVQRRLVPRRPPRHRRSVTLLPTRIASCSPSTSGATMSQPPPHRPQQPPSRRQLSRSIPPQRRPSTSRRRGSRRCACCVRPGPPRLCPRTRCSSRRVRGRSKQLRSSARGPSASSLSPNRRLRHARRDASCGGDSGSARRCRPDKSRFLSRRCRRWSRERRRRLTSLLGTRRLHWRPILASADDVASADAVTPADSANSPTAEHADGDGRTAADAPLVGASPLAPHGPQVTPTFENAPAAAPAPALELAAGATARPEQPTPAAVEVPAAPGRRAAPRRAMPEAPLVSSSPLVATHPIPKPLGSPGTPHPPRLSRRPLPSVSSVGAVSPSRVSASPGRTDPSRGRRRSPPSLPVPLVEPAAPTIARTPRGDAFSPVGLSAPDHWNVSGREGTTDYRRGGCAGRVGRVPRTGARRSRHERGADARAAAVATAHVRAAAFRSLPRIRVTDRPWRSPRRGSRPSLRWRVHALR